MSRLFFSLSVPNPLGEALLACCPTLPGLRRSRVENLHLTVRFLGDVDDELRAALVQLPLSAPELSLQLSRFALLSDRVLYAAVEPEEPVLRLAEQVEGALRRLGVAPEPRPFRPHVTVARLRGADPAQVLERVQERRLDRLPAWHVNGLQLVESHLRSDGPRYRVVQVWAP